MAILEEEVYEAWFNDNREDAFVATGVMGLDDRGTFGRPPGLPDNARKWIMATNTAAYSHDVYGTAEFTSEGGVISDAMAAQAGVSLVLHLVPLTKARADKMFFDFLGATDDAVRATFKKMLVPYGVRDRRETMEDLFATERATLQLPTK